MRPLTRIFPKNDLTDINDANRVGDETLAGWRKDRRKASGQPPRPLLTASPPAHP